MDANTNILAILPLVIFLIIAITISIYIRKKHIRSTQEKSAVEFSNEYFIGNKKLTGFVLAMTTVATYGSVSSFVGGPGQAWEFGFGWVYMAVIQVTALFLLYKILGKKLALIGHKINAITIVDVIKARFESNLLAIISALTIVIFFVAIMVAQFVGGAKIFEAVTGLDYKLGLIIFGICAVIFTTIGGFRGVAITDALCGVIMLAGLIILGIAIIVAGGGWGNIMHTISTNHPEMMQIDAGGKMPWTLYLSQWLLVGIFTFCLPQSTVRCLSAKNTKSLDKAMVIGTIVIGFMMIAATLIGVLAAGTLTQPLSSYGNSIDNIIPIAIVQSMPPWLTSIAIIGPIAASISTISSLLISASSALIKDIGGIIIESKNLDSNNLAMSEASQSETLSSSMSSSAPSSTPASQSASQSASQPSSTPAQKQLNPKSIALASQIATLALGILVIVLSLIPPDVIWKINMFAFGGLESSFAIVLILGLFSKKITRAGTITGMLAALISYCTSMAIG
ncbi:MAG: sodium/pantothenate symporter, partial [Coriobacteriales bacterium]|nr:sodium/pantothenate symporter [Coriobacteriales bacterium]